MLTQKQMFRKAAMNINTNMLNAFSSNTEKKKVIDKQDDETASVSQADSQSLYSAESDKPYSSRSGTADDVYDKTNYHPTADHIPLGLEENMPTPRKNVTFSNTVRVCLIPCRKELDVIKHHLWWSPYDIDFFKLEAYDEMKHYIESNKCSVKDALTKLYQPSKEEVEAIPVY